MMKLLLLREKRVWENRENCIWKASLVFKKKIPHNNTPFLLLSPLIVIEKKNNSLSFFFGGEKEEVV